MSNQPLVMDHIFYGISPWESEVAYGYFNSKFKVNQREIEPDDDEFVSFVGLTIPVEFSEAFFKWFEFRRWEKVKDLFKEMKRRRGSGNALKISITFTGTPSISFIIDTHDKQKFSNAIEKMDFVLELIPYQLSPEKLPPETQAVTYRFDSESVRWIPHTVKSKVPYIFKNNEWQKAQKSQNPK